MLENDINYALTYPVNKKQTKITDKLLADLNDEVKDQFLDFISTVPFIQRLIAYDRPRAKDLKRDKKGRIIVDVTKPHILENMDYFRPTAICFEKYNVPTLIRKSSSPNSRYGKWIEEEARRCHEGYVRESDGEWIPGDYYYFLNYFPMNVIEDDEDEDIAVRTHRWPSVWEGHYYMFHYMWQARHNNQNSAVLASRSKGKTATAAAMLNKRIELGETVKHDTDVTSIALASVKSFLIGGDVLLDKFQDNLDFCAENTEFPRHRNTDTENGLRWELGFKRKSGTKGGVQNVVMGMTLADDIKKIRGSRASLYIVEEFGSFPNLKFMYKSLQKSVKYGGRAFGIIHLQGTSGDKQSDFEGAQELIRNPKGYDLYALENVYDKKSQGRTYFTYFFPGYLNLDGFYDHDGNSDVVGALLFILNERFNTKYNSDDPQNLIRTMAEVPIVPEEAMLRVSNNIFPTIELNLRIAELESDSRLLNSSSVGTLYMAPDNTVKFKPTDEVPIRIFPHNDNKLPGALEIWEMPHEEAKGKVDFDRYIIGVDPVDQDSADSVSLFSILVMDMFTERIVAEFTGRRDYSDYCYEMTRLLSYFYDADVYYENNIKGLYGYFDKMNCLNRLADTPKYLSDKGYAKPAGIGNTSKGIRRTTPVIRHAHLLVNKWLMEPTTRIDKDGKETDSRALYDIRSLALLKELSMYNDQNNFDRVCALEVLMIGLNDKVIINGGDIQKHTGRNDDPNYVYNSTMFD